MTGPQFNSLHAMFETQYNELWLAADEVAERIRTLDVFAPGSYSQFGKLSAIKEESGVPDWKDMVGQLVEGHEIVAHTARETIKVADKAGDEGTADMVTGRLKEHEKTAWMLRSLLKWARPVRHETRPADGGPFLCAGRPLALVHQCAAQPLQRNPRPDHFAVGEPDRVRPHAHQARQIRNPALGFMPVLVAGEPIQDRLPVGRIDHPETHRRAGKPATKQGSECDEHRVQRCMPAEEAGRNDEDDQRWGEHFREVRQEFAVGPSLAPPPPREGIGLRFLHVVSLAQGGGQVAHRRSLINPSAPAPSPP